MSSSADIVREEIAKKKATFEAEMAKLTRKEKEAVEEAACKAEAAWLAAEKAAKKTEKKGKKRAVEESGADAGAKGSKPTKRAKTVVADEEDEIETTEVSC